MGEFNDFLNNKGGKSRVKAKDFTTVRPSIPKNPSKKRKKKLITYTTKKEFDFLKYYIIVENYYKRVVFPELSLMELKCLFLLYSEPPFTRYDFKDYCRMLKWKTSRLNQWIEKGIAEEYVVSNPKHKNRAKATLYTLTKSTKRRIAEFYKKLLLAYKIDERPTNNPLFAPTRYNNNFADRQVAKAIVRMNKGKYNENKTDEDWEDIRSHTFEDKVKDFNKNNNETLIRPIDIDE